MNLRYIHHKKDKETSFEINRISQYIEVISKSYTEKNRNRLSRYVKNSYSDIERFFLFTLLTLVVLRLIDLIGFFLLFICKIIIN